MKVIRSSKDKFVFEFSAEEKQLLLEILKRFPLVPIRHHRLNKSDSDAQADNQRLLEESLAAHKSEHHKHVAAMLSEPTHFKAAANGFRLALARPEIEWLLQVLNDVRVGSWLALGAPDLEREDALAINHETAPHLWRMELAGHFESFFLSAVDGRNSSE